MYINECIHKKKPTYMKRDIFLYNKGTCAPIIIKFEFVKCLFETKITFSEHSLREIFRKSSLKHAQSTIRNTNLMQGHM